MQTKVVSIFNTYRNGTHESGRGELPGGGTPSTLLFARRDNACFFHSAAVNVAFGRPTFMSKTYFNRGPSLAVDGSTQADFMVTGSCSFTQAGRPWWAVDLGVVANVELVAISQAYLYGKGDINVEYFIFIYIYIFIHKMTPKQVS